MYALLFVSCFEDTAPLSSEPNEDVLQDVHTLKEMLEQQSNQLQSLQEDYELLLSEYNTIIEQNQQFNQQLTDLSASHDLLTSDYDYFVVSQQERDDVQDADLQSLSSAHTTLRSEHDAFVSGQEELDANQDAENLELWTSLQDTQDTIPNVIMNDVTWLIDPSGAGDYISLSDAQTALMNTFILPSALLTLQLADGTHTLSSVVRLDHPNGDRIVLQGNTQDPSAVVLDFVASNGFQLWYGNAIAQIKNLQITGTSDHSGLIIQHGSTVTLENIHMSGFGNCLLVQYGGIAALLETNIFEGCSNGVRGSKGAIVYSQNDLTTQNNSSNGINLSSGSILDASTVQSSDNNYGLTLSTHSFATIPDLEIVNNAEDGVLVRHNSTLFMNNAVLHDNAGWGLKLSNDSQVAAREALFSNNTSGGLVSYDSYGDFFGSTFENNDSYGLFVEKTSSVNHNSAVYQGHAIEDTHADATSHLFE
ncbi:MAG: hypothetical protein CMK59_07810 [Proteobacteria bacterium]|nr:hypothetical protein [Pseudomonadota bacterium]